MNPATDQYNSAHSTWSKTIFTRRLLFQRLFAGVIVLGAFTFHAVGFEDDLPIPGVLVALTILTGLALHTSGIDVTQCPKPGRITR